MNGGYKPKEPLFYIDSVWVILKILFSVVVPAIFSCPLISLITYTSLHAPAQSLSHAQLFKTLWTVAHQAPLSMDSPR